MYCSPVISAIINASCKVDLLSENNAVMITFLRNLNELIIATKFDFRKKIVAEI